MNDTRPDTPPETRPETRPDKAPTPRRRSFWRGRFGLAAGFGVGGLLWMIISVTTQNLALGLVFGLMPGVAIGLGLQATARR